MSWLEASHIKNNETVLISIFCEDYVKFDSVLL